MFTIFWFIFTFLLYAFTFPLSVLRKGAEAETTRGLGRPRRDRAYTLCVRARPRVSLAEGRCGPAKDPESCLQIAGAFYRMRTIRSRIL